MVGLSCAVSKYLLSLISSNPPSSLLPVVAPVVWDVGHLHPLLLHHLLHHLLLGGVRQVLQHPGQDLEGEEEKGVGKEEGVGEEEEVGEVEEEGLSTSSLVLPKSTAYHLNSMLSLIWAQVEVEVEVKVEVEVQAQVSPVSWQHPPPEHPPPPGRRRWPPPAAPPPGGGL